MTCTTTLPLNPGSDYRATAIVRDQAGSPVDLTEFTAALLDLSGDLANVGALAFTISNAAAGEVTLTITWGAGWATTFPRVIGTGRLQLVRGAEQTGSAAFTVIAPNNAARAVIPRGGDTTWQMVWPDDSDGASLAGQTVEAVHVSAGLAGRVSVAVLDAVERRVAVTIEGDPALPVGDAGSFQLRRSAAGANRRTTPPLKVTVK